MFITTTGIVLRTYPFRDNKFIVKVFTRDDGLISCVLKKRGSQIILSELLTVAEITYKKTGGQSLVYVKEARVDYSYKTLTTCQHKIQCSIVLCEILSKCLSAPSNVLYDFVVGAFKYLDSQKKLPLGFDNLFLIKLCGVMGVFPLGPPANDTDNFFLSIAEGGYVRSVVKFEPKTYIPAKESRKIFTLSTMDFSDLRHYDANPVLNDRIFNYLIAYISVHLVDLKNLKSIRVLKELA